MKLKKKAFTLTELLVVVVVIGVLSAVVLPKFSKVIETRRTTEAEELMGAIRTEQEKRCALDKPYVTEFNKLTDIVKADNTKNYQLALAGTGVTAQRKDNYNYTLEMPSYADGRICCTGDDCEKLNKNYPLCDDLKRTSDYQPSPSSCEGEVPPPVPPTLCETDPTSCECNPNQAKCCEDGTEWNGTMCEPIIVDTPTPAECTNGEVRGSQPCNTCGTQTTQKCVNGKWTEELGACSKTAEECEEKDCCDSGFKGDFAACIAKKYGYESPEYICAKEGAVGIGSRAYQCSAALGMGTGNGLDYFLFQCKRNSSIKNEKDDTEYQYCKKIQNANSSWLAGGFKKFACTGEMPVIPPSSSGSGSGSSDIKPSTCTVKLTGSGSYDRLRGYGSPSCPFNFAGASHNCPKSWGGGASHGTVVTCLNHECLGEKGPCYASSQCTEGPNRGAGWSLNPFDCSVVKYNIYTCE